MIQDKKLGVTKVENLAQPIGKGGGGSASAPSGAKGTAGSYYAPREYGAQAEHYAARAEAARKAMEEQSKALRESQRALEQLHRTAQEKRDRWETIQGKLRGENAAELYRQVEAERSEAVRLYREGMAAHEQVWANYQPYEDTYNREAQAYNDYIRSEQEAYGQWKSTIRGAGDIRAEQSQLKEKRAELVRLMRQSNEIAAGTAAPGIMAQAAQTEARIRELQEYLGGVGEREKLLEEELRYSEHFRFEDMRQNPDFAERSRFTGVDNQGDRVYQYVNGNPNAVSGSVDALLDWGFQNEAFRDIIGHNETPTYLEYMTDEEKAMYNYVYSTQGRDAAQGYLDYLRQELTARKTGTVGEIARMLAGQNALTGALFSGLSVPMNAAGGLQAGLGQVVSALRGEELDPNASYNLMANTKNAVRDQVSTMVEQSFGPVGSYLYGTGMSMADMLMDAASGNTTAAMTMIGSRAFSEQVIDAKNRGLTDAEALSMGVTSAFAELVTEKLGLDELLKLPKKWETAGFWKGLLKGAGGEALEEGMTNLLNLAADISIAGDKSEFMRTVRANMEQQILPDGSIKTGMTEEEATKAAVIDALKSFGLDALGGALSGGAFGGYRGWQGKKTSAAQKNESEETKAPEAPEGEELPTVEDPGGQMPPQSQSDSSPTQSAGEPMEAAPVAGGAGESSADGTVSAQDVREDVQKGPEPVNENGGKANEEAGEHLLPGGTERVDAAGAGEPVGGYAQLRERQQTEARSQAEAAAQRRIKAENLEKRGHLRRVSSKDLGLRQGTEVQELLELPRIEWDQELYDTATRLEKETGMTVRAVTGNIGVRLKDGGVGLAKGYIDRVNKTIVLNVCHSQVTAGQIADHELWHHKMEAVGRISGNRYEVTRLAVQRIQEQYSPEDFDEVLDAYIDGYGDVYDQSNWEEFLNRVYEEIMADAYAGMNAFGVEASKFRSTVDSTMDELGMGRNMWNAAEQEDTPAPGGDQRVYADEDAPPMPEDEDYSQVPEYDWDGWDDSMADFSIEKLPDGKKYVRADRQVIMGNDPDSWSEQVEDYINGKIRRGGNVKLLAEDGDVLLLTATTAGKLSDYHDSHGRTLSDDAFYLKASAAVHIDELAATSIKDRTKTDVDGRHGSFAAKGWQYRTAFFQDFDGKYYRVSISVAQGENGNVVYNIGKIERRSHPTIDGSSARSGALGGKTSSKNMVSRAGDNVKGSDDVLFALDKLVEETKTLIAMHNLTEEKLEKAIDLGGFPMPSIAVTRADIPHTNFGEITLVMDKGTVDPKADRRNDVFSADAWTPTFPRTEYEANSEVEDRVRRTLQELERKIAPQFQGNLRRVMYGLEDLLNSYDGEENLIAHVLDNDGLKAVYLESQGKHIDEVQVEREIPKRYNQAAAEKYEAIIAALGTRDPAEIGTMPLKDIRDNFGAELEKVVPGISKTSLRLSRFMQQTIDYLMDDGSGPETEMVVDQNATRQALEDALDRDGYEAWVRELFSGIEGDKGIYNGKERFTPSGRSRSFQQTHLPVTLENIVKAMAAQNGGNTKNVSGFNGVKTLRAGTAQRFKSIQGMHDLEGRLQNLTEEEQTALTDGLQHRLYDLIDEIDQEAGRKGTSNNLIRFDQIGQIITEASETGRYNVSDIQKVFRENHQTISDELALKVKELLFDVSQMPVNLFEAKPRRAVRFDEVRAAVVPADASEELKRKLEKQGVPVIEYERDNTEDRLRKVNGIEDVRFSMDGTIQETDSEGRELSAEQQAFFKDSKVRNEDGRLIPVYHGTKTPEFNEFRYDPEHQTGADYGEAYYFTSDLVKAQGYGYDPAKDPRIAAYKKGKQEMIDRLLKNPTEENKRAALDYRLDGKNIHDFMWDETYLTEGGGVKVCYLNLVDPLISDAGGKFYFQVYPDLFKQARENGNDGMIVKNVIDNPRGEHRPIDVYIAFSRNQMKNVDNRKPTEGTDIRFSMDGNLSREEYERLAAEVAGDQRKRNEEFVKSRLTPEQYKQYKAFAREDRLDQEAEARVRGIERFEEAQAREELNALRARQAEDAAAGRRELAAEEKAAKAEAREKAGKAREERKRKAKEKREQLRQEARERIRRAAENAPADSVPTIARKELQDKLISLFSVGEGQRGELRREIGQLADRMIAEGTVDERDLRRLIDRLYESGVMVIEPEQVMAEGRSYLKDEHIYISPEQIRELGDDWLDLRKKAWGLGVYLTTDRSYAGLDVWNADMASYLPGLFDENETDSRRLLERLLHIAQEGKAEKVSLPEYTKRIAKAEHQSEEALLYNMERQVEEALRTFGEKASLEMRLKNRNARRRAMDREEAAIAREADRAELERRRQELADDREALRELNEAERDRLRLERAENDRRNAAERRRLAEERAARRRKHQETVRKKELRELQEKTLKALQWISKNRRKAPEAMQEAFDAVLGNIDLYAISMADEMRWSSKYGATWKDLKQMYLHAQATDPNFMPSEDLDRIVQRLDSVQLESMDFDQLRDLYQAAVGLRTEFYNRNNVIGSEEHQIMEELYSGCVEEMRTAPKKLKGLLDRFLNLEQLTPMNVFEEMGGFNPDGALYKFAQQLEDGERKVRSFKVRSNKILADFLEDNADWIHRADGQGKDGIWIEVEIPQLIGMKVGEVPEFGGTVKVAMTPMQRVHLYLESRNYDNLRHMTGGRTFADRELYSQGKREEAFAKGTTIRMAPETVQLLVKDMSPEEMELARLLDKYYNDLAATEINKVSNILLGYNKAMGGHYAPIFTNANYTKSEFGKFDGTAEGAGNLKERVKSKNPSYNISALEAFERNMDRTATYVGMAIPVRNWNTLMNWRTSNSSFADEITHSWGKGRLDYIQDLITDLQNPMGEQQDMVTEMSGKLLSNYISSVFGFNPSIVVKQLGSIPMASAYLDWKHFPKGVIGKGKIDRELIGRYTQELEWRTMGYSMPETKQLKDAPNWSQKNKAVGLVFGGDAITAMDGWAASVLWPWAENKVRAEFPGLEVGDAAMIESGQSPFYQKVAELFNDAVSRSQSVSDQMHQGRLRKSKHAAAKAVTMFRSDSAQSYNVLRQRLGELDYYRRVSGGEKMAEAAKKAVGAAATAVLINSIWGTTVDLLVKALKGKLDEEDKEPMQIAEDFFWGVIDSYAGMVTVGDIIAETVGNWFTGEMRFDQEAPGVEQFNDILQAADKIINAGKKGNLMGAIKIGAETVASYGFGLPAKNVEAYLMGLFSWALPGAKVAYEDLLKAPAKADLKGLEGDALTVRLNHVLKGYGVELEPDVREALAALYEAGYTEAVPSAAPDSVTVDGVELELDGRMKKEYDKTRGGIIEREVPEITGSAFFAQADEKTRNAMVAKLYNYAAEKAKEAVLEDYAISTTAQAIDEIVRSGGSAADYAVFDAVTADMAAWQRAEVLQEWGTDEAVTGLMFEYLVSKSWEDEQAELRKAGVDVGQFLELYAMHGEIDSRDLKAGQKATEFAYWLDGQRYTEQQKAAIKDQMAYFQMMPADASRYNMATAAGLDREQALELTEELDALEPPEGKTSVQEIQKYRVAIDQSVSESNQLKMLAAAGLKDSSYDKVAKGYEMGVAPAAWVRVKEVQQQFDANGNGSMTNAEWEAAIEGICSYGIVLPGDNTRFNLTNEQKAVLWQMLVGKSTKSKNNPFNPAAGQRWRELMGYE